MTRQERIDSMAVEHGRVSVSDGFSDDIVRVTTPDGAEYKIGTNGVAHRVGVNFSIDWSQ